MKIIFRKFENGDVIALFPEKKDRFNGSISSYMHIGQHSGANPELIDDLKIPTKEEYQPLLDELINQVGYKNLKIIKT